MKVFFDTSAWLALEIKNDQNHKAAQKYREKIQQQRAIVVTNDYVLAETYTRLIYDVHLPAAHELHQQIISAVETTKLTLLEIDPSGRAEAWEELNRYSDHQLSFTDATIIANFKYYRLDEIFTFDKTFAEINLPTNLET